MDIEDDDDDDQYDNEASEKEVGGTAKGGDERRGRSKNVQLADELMKSMLKPYFT